MASFAELQRPKVTVGAYANKFRCEYCRGIFEEPRRLDCQHIFCLECLQEQASEKGSSLISCFLCPKITHKAVDSLKPIPLLESLLKDLRLKLGPNLSLRSPTFASPQSLCEVHGQELDSICVVCTGKGGGRKDVRVCISCKSGDHRHHTFVSYDVRSEANKRGVQAKLEALQPFFADDSLAKKIDAQCLKVITSLKALEVSKEPFKVSFQPVKNLSMRILQVRCCFQTAGEFRKDLKEYANMADLKGIAALTIPPDTDKIEYLLKVARNPSRACTRCQVAWISTSTSWLDASTGARWSSSTVTSTCQ